MSSDETASHCPTIDCHNMTDRPLQPYADISGAGVLIGFVGTAYLVLLLVILNYFLAFDPNEDPFKGHAATRENYETSHWRPNPIDQRLITWLRKSTLLMPSTRKRLRAAFDEAIIMMCDVQLVTGIGILASGYMLLQCGLDACHWQIAVYLAWFSTVTHLSGLNILRGYLSTTPWAKHVRVLLMSALLVLVIVGLVPTGFFKRSNFSSQAICYFNQGYGDWQRSATYKTYRPVQKTAEWQAMVMSVILLVFGFVSRSFKLFRPLSIAFRAHMRTPISRFMQRIITKQLGERRSGASPRWRREVKLRVITRPAVATFLMVRLSCDLFGSTVFEVYWLLVILLWGTAKILAARSAIRSISRQVSLDEEQWTFGQILPVFLLLGPLFNMIGIFASKMTSTTSHDLGQDGREACEIGTNATGLQTRLYSRPAESIPLDALEATAQEYLREPPPSSVARADSIGNPSQVDLMHLKDYRDAQWLPICVAVPFLSIIAAITLLFLLTFKGFSFSLADSYTPLYSIWVDYNLIYLLLIGYPCACATTIRFGLGINTNGGWRKFAFFWLCVATYGVYSMLAVPFWFTSQTVASISGLIITASLYLGHVLISLIRILEDL
ncbi:hypothetical protein LX36DRAFT_655132 [Colletotrichum falcatum]|nr:hypothetical protein LX36DRAFT_655132 [Colletotrichum falcatum]